MCEGGGRISDQKFGLPSTVTKRVVINLWNSLDEESVSAVSVNSFREKLQRLHMDGSFPRLFKSA